MSRSKTIRLIFGVVALLVLQVPFAARAICGTVPPPNVPNMDHVPSTMTAPPVSKVFLGGFEIEFERTTLAQVRSAIGVGVVRHQGDAASSEDFICYSDDPGRRIWISSGELGGYEHAVTSIYATVSSAAPRNVDCPELPARFRSISIGKGIWLGSSTSSTERMLGNPSEKRNDWSFYSYSGKVMAGEFDRLTTLAVHVRAGVIVDLFASQSTTN
jgi:hypothetical protein